MIAKIDKDEILRELYEREVFVAIFTIVLILFITTGLLWYYHYRQRNIYRDLLNLKKDLVDSEVKFKYLFDNSKDVIFVLSTEGTILSTNRSFGKITGWENTEWLNRPFHKLVHPDDLEMVQKKIREILAGVESEPVEIRILRKAGGYIDVEINPSIFKISENAEGILGIARDITNRKQAENALIESEEKYKLLAESSPEMIYLVDVNGYVLYVNERAATQFNSTVNEITGKHLKDIFSPELAKRNLAGIDNVIKSGHPVVSEVEIEFPAGKVWVEAKLNPVFNNNRVVSVLGLSTDITKRKLFEAKLKESEEKYRSIFNNSAIGIFRSTPEGKYIEVNQAFAKILGFNSPGEMIDKVDNISTLYKYPEDREKIKDEFARIGFVKDYVIVANHPGSKTVYISINAKVYSDNNGRIFYEGTVQDITDRKKAEKELRLSEERFSVAFHLSPVAMAITSTLDNKFVDVNKAFLKDTGYTFDEVVGHSTAELGIFTDYSDRERLLSKIREEGYVYGMEIDFRAKSGKIMNSLVSANIIKITNVPHLLSSIADITQLKITENAIKESQKFLKTTQKIAQLGTYTLDIKSGTWESSEILDSIFGIEPGYDKSVEGWTSIVHPEWQQEMSEYFTNEVVGKKNNFDKEYKIVRKNNNTERWVHGMGELEFDNNGHPVKMIGTIRDITNRKNAEEEIKKLNRVYALLSNTNQAIVRIKDKKKLFDEICRIGIEHGKFLLVWIGEVNFETNKVEVATSAGDVENYLNKVVIDLNDKDTGSGPTGKAVKSGKHVISNDIENDEMMIPWKKIELKLGYRSTASFPLKVYGKVVGSMTICSGQKQFFQEHELELLDEMAMDISFALEFIQTDMRRKKYEEELLKFSRTVEQSTVAILITNPEGNIQYTNAKFTEVTGYSREEVLNKNPRFLKSGETPPEVYEELWDTLLSGNQWTGEILNKKKDGKLYWDQEKIFPLVNESGDVTHFIAIKEDITGRKRSEKELVEAKEKAEEMNKIKNYFLANMSHELRTPLIGILGYAEYLISELENEEMIEMVKTIKKSGDRLNQTLNNILDISKIEAEKMDINFNHLDLLPIINEQVKLFKPITDSKELSLNINSKEDEINAYIDEKLFISIMDNLLSNAIKYTKEGSITISAKKTEKYAVIEITDTGIGIPEEQQEIIFEPFRQASEGLSRTFEGTGLGLTLVKNYVQLQGGNIELKSTPGKGSTFTLKLQLKGKNDSAIETK